MIEFVKHDTIDKSKWDECISNSQYPIAYAYSWYLDAVSPQWDALIVKKKNLYTAVFPLTRKQKIGITYLPQPLFCQQLGLFYTEKICIESFMTIVRKKYPLVEINLNHDNYINNSNLSGATIRTNLTLDLNRPYEKIHLGYNSNRKRALKKAEKASIIIKESYDFDFFIIFFKNHKGLSINDLNENSYLTLKNIYTNGLKNSAVKLFFAYNQANEIVSVSMFLYQEDRIIFLLGTSNETGKSCDGMTLILDYVIRENCLQNKILDFEGSALKGIAKFYESLGGIEKNYISLKASRLPFPLKLIKKK